MNFLKMLIILTGASGSGKSTISDYLRELQKERNESTAVYLQFDSIGIPDEQERIKKFGSNEAWQEAKTREWIKRIRVEYLEHSPVIFDGQSRVRFYDKALKAENITNYKILLLDCDDEIRTTRLTWDRGQPELANSEMFHFAKYLRQEAIEYNVERVDTGRHSVRETAELILKLMTAVSPPVPKPEFVEQPSLEDRRSALIPKNNPSAVNDISSIYQPLVSFRPWMSQTIRGIKQVCKRAFRKNDSTRSLGLKKVWFKFRIVSVKGEA